MKSRQNEAILGHVRQLFGAGTLVGMAEGQLLERFLSRRDEVAFEPLVARHGPMVLGVCRRVLSDPHDVEDAFQATFLVLVRKAHSLRRQRPAGQLALRGRPSRRGPGQGERRPTSHARAVGSGGGRRKPPRDGDWRDLRPVLDEEIARLPEKYRAPVVLCFLEGQTHEEAARQLRWPLGTVKSRLARARARLQGRLTRRGLAPSAGMLGAWSSSESSAAVGTALVGSTVKAAMRFAASRSDGRGGPGLGRLPDGRSAEDHGHDQAEDDRNHLDGSRRRHRRRHGTRIPGPGGSSRGRADRGGAAAEGRGRPTPPKVHPSSSIGIPRRNVQRPDHRTMRMTSWSCSRSQLEKKRAEVRRAEAQIDLAKAVVARNTRLIARDPNYVSKEEQIKAESEVAIADAERDVKQTEVREVEERIRQAMRRQSQSRWADGGTWPLGRSRIPCRPGAEVEGDGSEAGSAHRGRRGPGAREGPPGL